jgi:hypothetical protein
MIGLFVKIAFHLQIKKADSPLAAELAAAAREAAALFRARDLSTEDSFFLVFDASSGCARLRAAEAARFLDRKFKPLSPRLHGWNIFLDQVPDDATTEELQRRLKRCWYEVSHDGIFVAPSALTSFKGYLSADPQGGDAAIRSFPYAEPALPSDYAPPELSATTLERFVDEAGSQSIGESEAEILLAVGPGSAPEDYLGAALGALYKGSASSFLWLHGAVGEPSPYGPFLRALAIEPSGEELASLSGPDLSALRDLGPVAEFLRSSPYRQGYSLTIRIRIKLYVAARLRLYARMRRLAGLPAVVVLTGIDRYPEPSLALVRELLGEGLKSEGLVAFATAAEPPNGLATAKIRIIAAPPPSPAAVAAAATTGAEALGRRELAPPLAAAAEGDAFRLALALRLASLGRLPTGHIDTSDLAAAVLRSYPEEFAEFVLALTLAEEVLDHSRLDDFLLAAGFAPGIRPLLYGQLANLGFLAKGPELRLRRRETALAAAAVAPEGGAAVKASFARRLLAMHASGDILPSEALFDRIEAGALPTGKDSLFFLDCAAADALYGLSLPAAEGKAAESAPIPGLSAFLTAYAAADPGAAEASLAAIEDKAMSPSGDPLAAAIAALARAFDDYARGDPIAAVSRAKPALIGLHGLGARRAEARAHRLLGLCALAQSQVQEGADYLLNAYELAEEVPDPLECILSAYAEAGALLVLGDIKRAELMRGKAAEWARSAFRADWEAACDFLEGRIAFELGRSAKADEGFGRVRAAARVYDQPEAALRAEIWSGRTAAYAGDGGRARELLSRHPKDAEALWFLAELYYFEGNPAGAAEVSSHALALLESSSYHAADAMSWQSGFDCLEARSLGFVGSRSYLADQIGAFAAFTTALVELKPEPILEIALLTREERLATLHPEAHLYHYYCYLDLAAAGGGPLDPATVLSKAFKALQTRTARIDDASLKDEYLEGNRWNREILAEARRHKLI